jgi:NAD-dependent dihydropyrimidine dehydrogenase PreA subunit
MVTDRSKNASFHGVSTGRANGDGPLGRGPLAARLNEELRNGKVISQRYGGNPGILVTVTGRNRVTLLHSWQGDRRVRRDEHRSHIENAVAKRVVSMLMMKILNIVPQKCTGCMQCELACSWVQTGMFQPSRSMIRVNVFDEEASYAPYTCLQCDEAWCMSVCPVNAITTDKVTGAKVVCVAASLLVPRRVRRTRLNLLKPTKRAIGSLGGRRR